MLAVSDFTLLLLQFNLQPYKRTRDDLHFGNENDKSYASSDLMLERGHVISTYGFTSWRTLSLVEYSSLEFTYFK